MSYIKFKIGDLVKHESAKDLYGIVILFENKINILMIGVRKEAEHTGKMYHAHGKIENLMEKFWNLL